MVFDPRAQAWPMPTLTGKLLVASPVLSDPNFRRTVVLVCGHEDGGSFGVVLNRPLPMHAADRVPEWGRDVAWPVNLFSGGPVEESVVLGIARSGRPRIDAWWADVAGVVGLVSLRADPADVLPALAQLRIFAGYAGWGGGQLEAEIANGDWFVIDVAPGDAFTDEPERLWHNVLRRQPGELQMVAFVPEDPRVN